MFISSAQVIIGFEHFKLKYWWKFSIVLFPEIILY